jgi:deoxyribonuclease V
MKPLHPWNVTREQAIRIQENLRHRVILKKTFLKVRTIGGGDVSYQEEGNLLFAAMVVLSFPRMETLDVTRACGKISFPYLSGLLTFREGPILVKTFEKLRMRPDILIFDGQGIAHPRGIGLATHLGLWFDLPSIGCAKTPLLGKSAIPGPSRGSFELIQNDGNEVGVVLRTRDRVKPVFVSPGHRIDLLTSIRVVLESCQGFRIPEPLRRAHQLSRQMMQSA